MREALSVFAVIVSAFAHSATISFDGGDPVPLKRENVSVVKGLSGNAVHLSKDSLLEFSSSLPGFMTPTAGTFMVWFKHDDTLPSCNASHDFVMAENFNAQWIPHSGVHQRSLFASGDSFVWGGVSLRCDMGPATFGNCIWWGRRILGGEWHFAAVSYDSAKGKAILYADGVVAKTRDFEAGRKIPLGKTFTLASGGEKLGLDGTIDEVTILPLALDEDALRREYLKHQPIRYELHDWSVGEGETKSFRFRARNESAEPVEKTLKFSNGATVVLSLEPNELKEFTVNVKGDKPGLFKLWLNEGEVDARQFECMCLGEEPRNILPTRKTLIGEYDCTKEYPRDRAALCTSEIVTNGPLVYLESREDGAAVPLAAYRFAIRNQGKPHIVEIDYPDDKMRWFLVSVFPEKWGRIYSVSIDCAGVMTGVDYPLSMEMQKKRFVFWPDSDAVAVVIQNYHFNRHAAVAAVRMYEMDSLPLGPVQGMSKGRRTVAEWDEDPTIDADLTFNNSWNYKNADLEFWRVKWQRVIDYMRWNSQDSWVIKVAAYFGDATGMYATIPEAALPWKNTDISNGRCRGWAELGADMLERAGMGFWVKLNHRGDNYGAWFSRLGHGESGVGIGFMDSNGGLGGAWETPNFLRPSVRAAYRRLIESYRDKFGRYSGFRGIAMNEACPIHFHNLSVGYDDYTIEQFQRDTGIAVPGTDAKSRYVYLTSDHVRKESWVKWRCEKTEQIASELASILRAKGGDAEIQIWISPVRYCRNGSLKWEEWNAKQAFREAGLDLPRLAKIPGVRFVPSVGPDWIIKRKYNDSDMAYLPDSPSWRELMQKGEVAAINVFRCANLEIYPSIGNQGAAARAWRTDLWTPAGNLVPFHDNFQSYPTPHARPPYTLDSVASLIADCDVQDFITGWWGLMESGEHDEWCRFYGQFRQIPRGRYALAKGPDDPVCVRSGAEGHYLVNREPYSVEIEYIVDGKPETLILRHHEIRFVKGRGANGAVEVKSAKIPTAERATHLANLEKLEAAAKADEKNATLARAAKEARTAFYEGRFRQFRALFHLGVVRKVFNPELFSK